MRLYAGNSEQFVRDAVRNQIAEKLRDAFVRHYRYSPSPSEVHSWRNSLRAMSDVVEEAGLMDHGVILEYQLPLSSRRLDCLLCGKDDTARDQAVIVELKQWERCHNAPGENEVLTWLGGGEREVLHPSVQVGQYRRYLQDTHTAFYEGPRPILLNSCSYLHNYHADPEDVILSRKFADALIDSPLFTADNFDTLADFLASRLGGGEGLDVLARVEESRYRPSKKLMGHVAKVIRERSEYVLLDEQLVVYDKVFSIVGGGFRDRQKTVLIVKGGPGTGKSVIAINLMADLLRAGYNTHYATNSSAFTKTLRKIVGDRAAIQFNFFMSYDTAPPNAVDVLVCDEAHRLKERTRIRFRKSTGLSQVEEVLRAAKMAVFFIDDLQVVRPEEVGSVAYIREAAEEMGCAVHEYELEAQFRCSGSDSFVNWVDNTLGVRRTANVIWDASEETFDFRIFPDPQQMEEAIREKVAQAQTGRMTAGFCWEWSKDVLPDGTLANDVVIGDYRRPWNAREQATGLSRGIPKSPVWAYESGGIDQIGCVYTAQGFEFDYVGVVFGGDLTYDPDHGGWVGHPDRSFDEVVSKRAKGEHFADLVKKTYRVLLTRGMKGCYVHFTDKETERFFRSRMEGESLRAGSGAANQHP